MQAISGKGEILNKIGIDFGTTNSKISYVDNGEVKMFNMGGAGQDAYIPSAVAYSRSDNEIGVGRAAKEKDSTDWEVCQWFKMLLALEGDTSPQAKAELRARGYSTRSPSEVGRDYFRILLDTYKRELSVSKIDHIVVTVPLNWDSLPHARAFIKKIFVGLNYLPEQISVRHEPEAAIAYFAHCYASKEKKSFNGHVLLVDYGGGTLDVTLARVRNRSVSAIASYGDGKADIVSLGSGGVAFDEFAIEASCLRGGKQQKPDGDKLREAINDFERRKIADADGIRPKLLKCKSNPANTVSLFTALSIYPITSVDMVTAYETINEKVLNGALEKLRSDLPTGEAGINPDSFRIILVGGFSNFCLVRKQVQDFFGSVGFPVDLRFDSCFNLSDTSFAVAKGAALVANEMQVIEQRWNFDVGVIAKEWDEKTESYIFKRHMIVKGGTLQKDLATPRFYEKVFKCSHSYASIKLFLGWSDSEAMKFTLKDRFGTAADILPGFVPDTVGGWYFGFSVNADLELHIHLKEETTGQVKSIALGDVINEIVGEMWVSDGSVLPPKA